jgi:hypothetical protein
MRHHLLAGLVACLLVCLPAAGSPTPEEADEQLLRESKIPTEGPALLDFFRQRAAGAGDVGSVQALIRRLGDDDFFAREDASRRLKSLGGRGRLPLRQALTDPDVEVRFRARECLRQIDQGEGTAVVAAAVRVLARRRPEGAAAVLLDYLPAAEDDAVAEEIREALAPLAAADAKTAALLEAALKDASPAKRAAAGVALLRTDPRGRQAAVRKLLGDSEAAVRGRVALALAAARDKEAVPALIDLLAEDPLPETRTVPEVLCRLAGDKAPAYPAKPSADALRKYRDEWKTWWKNEGEKVDAARLEEVAKTAGNTLVLLLDAGRAIYLDASNRPLWELKDLQFPLDAQLLPNGNVLVAEHNGGRVTERNRKNEVVWEKKVEGPTVAQRLPNGNTFIATRDALLEFDGKGEEVFRYSRPNVEMIMKAQKLPNGDYACVTQRLNGGSSARYVRLDAQKRELKSFNVTLNYSGGRICVLPDGHVLIPETNTGRVVEHDPNGHVVWEAACDQPVAAVRLPTGNTLVTSMNPQRGAAELDRAGKDAWQYRADTRVTRAFRHE